MGVGVEFRSAIHDGAGHCTCAFDTVFEPNDAATHHGSVSPRPWT